MAQLFSLEQLEQLRKYLEQFFMTKEDWQRIEARLESRFDRIEKMLDTYLKRSEIWRQEQLVTSTSHTKLRTVLISKSIVNEDEVSIS